jgi:hypothetical protein
MRVLMVAVVFLALTASVAYANDQHEEAAKKLLGLMDAEATAVGGAPVRGRFSPAGR